MADPFVISRIKVLPLFEDLPDVQLALVADAFQVEQYDAGDLIFQQGQPSRGLLVFVDGRATLVRGDASGAERPIGDVTPNKFLNESALFSTAVERASLRADAPSIVLVLERAAFQQLLTNYPQIKANIKVRVGDQRAHIAERVFDGQLDNETVLIITRRHPWVFIRLVWLPILIAALLLVCILLSQSLWLSLILVLVLFALPGGIMFYFYLEWRNDRIIVTTQRIISEEENILRFSQNVSKVPLESIQEVNAETPFTDPFARLFRYGTLELKTAGTAGNVTFDMIPNAEDLQQMIFKHRDMVRQEAADRNRSVIRAEVDRLLGIAPETPPAGQAPAAPQKSPAASQAQAGVVNPLRLQFVNNEGELVYRKHWIVWIGHVILPMSIIAVGVVLLLATLFIPALRDVGAPAVLFSLFVIMVAGVWFYLADWDWRNDLYIVGKDSIRVIKRRPLWLANQTDQILISRVDNVTAEQRGFLDTALNVGDVRISLVGSDLGDAKVFESVYDPQRVQEEIARRQARMKSSAQESELRRQREVFGEYISVYHERTGGAAPVPTFDEDDDLDAQATPASAARLNPLQQPYTPPRTVNPAPDQSGQGGAVPPLQDRIRPPHIPRPRKPG